ncbi:neurocan core protein-like [Gadus chalcogrammus]|uniref:neurocan core protein-like n=1 Tax=Gadus chalcogrammus TaxID=1042646 RepID=UPI0024C4E542|nr:neurocan core protein-like [Gadus chalcogrammus]
MINSRTPPPEPTIPTTRPTIIYYQQIDHNHKTYQHNHKTHHHLHQHHQTFYHLHLNHNLQEIGLTAARMRGGAITLGLLQLLLLVELGHTAALNSTITVAPHITNTLEVAHHITHLTRCQSEREKPLLRPGSYVPTCDDGGNFTPMQCSASTGYCWCVNIYTGVEIPGTRTPPGNTPPRCDSDHEPFSGDFCPPGWTRYGLRCFNFIKKPTRWIQAQMNCRFQGSNLVSVHSQEENRFLQEFSGGAPLTWIGAEDCIEPIVFLWTDGSAFDYENFPRFPMKTNGNCVGMNVRFYRGRRVWMKDSCESLNPYICANNI